MASFVRQTIGMYRSGFDSRRMLLQVRPLTVQHHLSHVNFGCHCFNNVRA